MTKKTKVLVNEVSDRAFPVDLRDLVKPLAVRNLSNLRERFENYIGQFSLLIVSKLYKSTTYVGTTNKTTATYLIDQDFAEAFCTYVNPVKGFTYVQSLKAKVAEQQTLLLNLETTKVARLTAQIILIQDKPTTVLAMSSKVNRRSIHQMRRDLHNEGMCNMEYRLVKHYRFGVTTKGFINGYEENDKGDIII